MTSAAGARSRGLARRRAEATFAAPVTPAAGRASSSDEPELTGSATASEAVFARIRHAEASGRVIDLAADDDAAPAPKRVKTEKDYYDPSDGDSFDPFHDLGEYVSSAYGMYKKDDPDSELVQSAAAGDIANVRRLVEKTTGTFLLERAQLVNAARRWTEVQEKWGYDKSWEWYGDTALIAAARRGHAEVVRYLLDKALADPTLVSCVNDDEMESAEKACEVGKQSCERLLATLANSVFTEHSQRQYEQNCDRKAKYDETQNLLAAALPYWEKNRHSSACYKSADVRSRCVDNRPNDEARWQLHAALAGVPCAPPPALAPPPLSDEDRADYQTTIDALATGKCTICMKNDANRACARSCCGSCCACGKHKNSRPSSKRKR